MKTYIGTKFIRAVAMTRAQYNDFRGWPLPSNENGDDEGYLVEYMDGGRRNTQEYEGYVSWSPADVFEKSYRPTEGLTFGLAIQALKSGKRVARAGWNGKGMWLLHVHNYAIGNCHGISPMDVGLGNCLNHPWIGMKTADNNFVPWLASQTDMLAEDWGIVE